MSKMCFHTALLRADYWRKQQNRITTAALLGNIAQNKNVIIQMNLSIKEKKIRLFFNIF